MKKETCGQQTKKGGMWTTNVKTERQCYGAVPFWHGFGSTWSCSGYGSGSNSQPNYFLDKKGDFVNVHFNRNCLFLVTSRRLTWDHRVSPIPSWPRRRKWDPRGQRRPQADRTGSSGLGSGSTYPTQSEVREYNRLLYKAFQKIVP